MTAKNVLITGGAGFIGSNFIHYLLNQYAQSHIQEYYIVNLDKLTYAGNLENLQDISQDMNYAFVKGDIGDAQLVNNLFVEYDFELVIHFAAESYVDKSILDSREFIKTNIAGTHNLLNQALKHWRSKDMTKRKFVYISTDEVYGSIEQGSFVETDALNPRNPYSASKAGAELLAMSYYHTYGLPMVITRSCNVYGRFQHVEKLIPKLVQRIYEREYLPIYGHGLYLREWIHVTDVCRAIGLVMEKGKQGQIYNISGQEEITNLELCHQLIDRVKQWLNLHNQSTQGIDDRLIALVEDRLGHDYRYSLNIDKIKELGFEKEIDWDTGIKQTIDWYLTKLETESTNY